MPELFRAPPLMGVRCAVSARSPSVGLGETSAADSGEGSIGFWGATGGPPAAVGEVMGGAGCIRWSI